MVLSFAGGSLVTYSISEEDRPQKASQMALVIDSAERATDAPPPAGDEQIVHALTFNQEKTTLPPGLLQVVEETEQPLLTQMGPSDALAMKTEVPMPVNRLVHSVMGYLLERPEDHLYPWMRRSTTYFPMIESIFAEKDVPDELKYLALVESGLQTRARSWADAAGIWQFVRSTGRAYGLEISDHVDERLDPVKASHAAARHLRDLYYLFDGDWLLALSGYNCSPTVIRQAIRRVAPTLDREPTFWDIYPHIPRETRAYVPTFIAASIIMSNPAAFGLKRVLPGPRYAFDYVPVRGALSLAEIASMAGTSKSRLHTLNPELLTSTLPPGPSPYYVRLPYGTYETFLDEYAAYLQGDGREQVAVAAVDGAAGNKQDPIQSLLADAPPRRVRYTSRTMRPIAGVAPYDSPHAGQPLQFYHVRSGDTLYDIATQYDVSVSKLMLWNDLGSSSLRPGQRLKIYG